MDVLNIHLLSRNDPESTCLDITCSLIIAMYRRLVDQVMNVFVSQLEWVMMVEFH